MNQGRSTILVPVDFSETSQRAIDLAAELAPALSADVVLIHVFEPPSFAYPVAPEIVHSVYQEWLPKAKKELDELAAKLSVRSLFREGNPGHEIVRAAEELSPRMIVMGTHGRRGIRRLVLGSVAEHVLRHASVPVTTVRSSPAP